MKSFKSEKGAITILALVSMLFILSFLMSSYMITSNKAQKQMEISNEIQSTYRDNRNLNEIYNSYFKNDIIPIYTAEQLIKIGSNEELEIKGNLYRMTPSATYALMDNIKIYESQGWTPINNDGGFTGYFQGNGHTIEVLKDGTENDVVVTYSELNNYSIQPEITLDKERIALSIGVGETKEVILTATEEDGTIVWSSSNPEIVDVTATLKNAEGGTIVWSSSNPEIVDVTENWNDVTLTFNIAGSAIITASYEENGKTYEATCSIVVE